MVCLGQNSKDKTMEAKDEHNPFSQNGVSARTEFQAPITPF